MARAEYYEGPLPDPATLAQFDRIVAGGAERIFQQFEEQGRTRRMLEVRREWRAWFAQGSAFIVSASLIGGGFALLFTDRSVEGLRSSGSSIGALVWAFRRSTKE